jgi:PPM family protein phosphatase
MITVVSAGITDVGRKRKGNEDTLLLDGELQLYIVADGMGGHQAGEVASRLVVDTIRDYMKRFKEGCAVDGLKDSDPGLSKEGNRLLSSICLANYEVNQLAQNNEFYRGMGSTVSVVFLADDILVAANVGDSPIYLVRGGGIEELSVQHTVLAEQAALYPGGTPLLGEMYRHMLTRAMGVQETVKPDIREVRFLKDEIVIICSDGLSNKVSPEEVLEIVSRETPEKACRLLVDLANNRGGEDNITIAVIKAKEVENEGSLLGNIPRKILAALRSLIPDWF